MVRVAIIGSGIAGLAAASHLVEAGHDVTVYEADGHIGGHACTQQVKYGKPSPQAASKEVKRTSNGQTTTTGASLSSSSSGDDITSMEATYGADIGFQVFNQVTYPNMLQWFDKYGVTLEKSDMSLAVAMPGGPEWSSNGINGVFADRCNLLNPKFYRMIYEMTKFEKQVLAHLANESRDHKLTLGQFLKMHGYSNYFRDNYVIPVCAAVWSCPSESCLNFPCEFILEFMRNHHLLQLYNRPQWLTVGGRSESYVAKVTAPFKDKFRLNTRVTAIIELKDDTTATSNDNGDDNGDTNNSDTNNGDASSPKSLGRLEVVDSNGDHDRYDAVVVAAHAPDALKMLGEQATPDERRILGAFKYQANEVVLHRDASIMPRRKRSWASWNFTGYRANNGEPADVCVSYWVNRLQNLSDPLPLITTLNPVQTPRPDLVISRQTMYHPVPSQASVTASKEMHRIQGIRNIYFCGAYTGYGFHEDGFKSGMIAANALLRGSWRPLANVTHFPIRTNETMARMAVFSFFKKFIKRGQLNIREVGGTVESFGTPSTSAPAASDDDDTTASARASCSTFTMSTHFPTPSSTSLATPNVRTRSDSSLFAGVQSPPSSATSNPHVITEPSGRDLLAPPVVNITIKNAAFYTKVAFRFDLGIADAYIDGDMTCSDMTQFVRLLIINQRIADSRPPSRCSLQSFIPILSAGATTLAYLRHKLLRKNTVAQARRNIHQHYDLGNKFFASWLDESMVYSCAIYRSPRDTLYDAQMNKLEALTSKARLSADDHLLEIGCGWGALSLYAAKKTGCKVTGITVSEQQLAYCRDLYRRECELDTSLRGRVNFELVDYRVFAKNNPGAFTRIISCEMLEAVGHDYLGDFYRATDRLLSDNGLLVVQVITFPDHRYDAYRTSVDFIREYIFPGGLCPSNAALTAAMQKNSKFMVEHLENIGPHYATTLASWRDRFWTMLRNRRNDDDNRLREAQVVHDRRYTPTVTRTPSTSTSDSKRSLTSSSSSSSTVTNRRAPPPKMALTYSHVNEAGQLPRGADPTRDERFIRMWDYYYVYCEAAFATRTLSVLQIVYTRQQNSSLA